VVLVTGRVLVSGRQSRAEEVAQESCGHGGSAIALAGDVSCESNVVTAFDKTIATSMMLRNH
jgi:hypothetical protein